MTTDKRKASRDWYSWLSINEQKAIGEKHYPEVGHEFIYQRPSFIESLWEKEGSPILTAEQLQLNKQLYCIALGMIHHEEFTWTDENGNPMIFESTKDAAEMVEEEDEFLVPVVIKDGYIKPATAEFDHVAAHKIIGSVENLSIFRAE